MLASNQPTVSLVSRPFFSFHYERGGKRPGNEANCRLVTG